MKIKTLLLLAMFLALVAPTIVSAACSCQFVDTCEEIGMANGAICGPSCATSGGKCCCDCIVLGAGGCGSGPMATKCCIGSEPLHCSVGHCCKVGETYNLTSLLCETTVLPDTCFELGGDGKCQGLPGTKDYCCGDAFKGHCEVCCSPENVYENCGECEYCNTAAGINNYQCLNQPLYNDMKNDCPINKACNGFGSCSCVDYGALHSPPCSWPVAPIVENCVKYELIMCVDDCNDCPGGCEIGPNPFFGPIYQTCCLADNTPECVDRCVLEEGGPLPGGPGGCNDFVSPMYPNGCCDPFNECVDDHCCPEGATWNFTTHRCDTPGTCTVSPPTCDVTWGCTGPTGCYKEKINQNCPTGYDLVKELGASMVLCAKAPPCAAVNPVQGCKCCAEGMPATLSTDCTDCNSNWRLSNCHCCPTGTSWNDATAQCEEECPLDPEISPLLTYYLCANEHTGGFLLYGGECGRECYNGWYQGVKESFACEYTEQCVTYNVLISEEGVKNCRSCVKNLAACCYPGMVVGEGDNQTCNDCGMYLDGCHCCPKDYEWNGLSCEKHDPCYLPASNPLFCNYRAPDCSFYPERDWFNTSFGFSCVNPTLNMACCFLGEGLFGYQPGEEYYYWHEYQGITTY